MPRAALLLLALAAPAVAQGTKADYERAAGLRAKAAGGVVRDRVEPRWSPDGNRFWYKNALPGGGSEHVVVDAEKGTREVVPADKVPDGWGQPRPTRPRAGGRDPAASPDGKWAVVVRDHNVWLKRDGGPERQLSWDGVAGHAYAPPAFWAPDSSRFVVVRTKAGADRRVTFVESAPRDQVQPKTHAHFYLKPGDEVPHPRPHLFDAAAGREIPVADDLAPNPWDNTYYHWAADSSRFFYLYNQRGHQVVRVVAVDAETGKATAVVNEECRTFFDYSQKLFLHHLEKSDELLWTSERSGWNHLYRVNRRTGAATPVTSGEWVVRAVESVDEAKGEATIRACGLVPGEDPYQVHYARVKLDGSGLTRLTGGDGTHAVTPSPDGRFLLDSYSRPDLPPVTELRRAADGSKVLTLETADASGLKKAGIPLPERFVAKGRDGTTDIHGLIFRPSNFDPNKSYRVVEHIYAGPHGQHVTKRFHPVHYEQAMAELGFVVVKLDGMGTNWRSKAFHDVCWKNLGDAGFPDRIAWIKAAAARHPQLDIANGVGIYGGSAGGQNAVRGMTEHPGFYTVGVADCGCHDNRMDKIWWNEAWMGFPVGPHYAAQSNVTNAHKLRGKLLLVVGEVDRNVDPASTMQVADALVRADKDFDLLVIPGAGHGAAETPYGSRRRADFFVRHLLGVEPRGK